MRSFTDPPGLRNSHLASKRRRRCEFRKIIGERERTSCNLQTSHSMPRLCGILFSLTIGVNPIWWRMLGRIFLSSGELEGKTIKIIFWREIIRNGTYKGLLVRSIPFHRRDSESGRSKSGSISSIFKVCAHEPLGPWTAVIISLGCSKLGGWGVSKE